MSEQIIHESEIAGERKTFQVSLRENGGGRFLRIVEQRGGVRNMVIIPEEMMEQVVAAIVEAAR